MKNERLNILAIEDQESSKLLLQKLFEDCDNLKAYVKSHLYSIFTYIDKFNIKVLILDYEFPGSNLSEEDKVLEYLNDFDGLVVIFSIHPVDELRKELSKKLKKFRIINKNNAGELKKLVMDYQAAMDKVK